MKNFKVFVIISVLVFSIVLTACSGPGDKYNDFAKCVSEKGAVFYGAFWCPHCQRVKKSFGDAFEFINYVECDPRDEKGQPEVCQAEEIDKYLTIRFEDGSELVGEPTLAQIAAKTGCQLPEE